VTGDLSRQGTVQSHTVIRVPGKAHAANAPFVLLLVRLDNGNHILGHFYDNKPPPINSRVSTSAAQNETPSFSILGGTA
jgi:uncharacterized OB-fold protein